MANSSLKSGAFLKFFTFLLLCLLSPSVSVGETPTLESLRAEEALLQQKYEAVSGVGHSPQAVIEAISQIWDSMSEQERAQLADKKLAKQIEPGSKGSQIIELTKTAGTTYADFQSAYDTYNNNKFDYMIERYHQFAQEVMQLAPSKLSAPQVAKLKEMMRQLETHKQTYYENKGNMGTRNDRGRGQGYRRFMWTMDRYLDTAGKGFRTWPESLRLTWDKFIRPFHFRGSSNARWIPAAAVLAPHIPGVYRALKDGKGILDRMEGAASAIGGMSGANMRIHGRENVVRETEPGTINVYAGMHPHSTFDLMSITKMHVDKPIVLTALAPARIRDMMIASEEFIVVGQEGVNPVNRIAELVREGKGKSIVIYPEGMMNLWGYDTRPPQKNFALMLQLLRKEGLKVNLIPFSQPDSYQMNETQSAGIGPLDTKRLNTYVHEAIPPHIVDILLTHGDRQLVSQLLRQTWIETTHEKGAVKMDRVAGMPRVDIWQYGMDKVKSQNARCHQFYDMINSGS